MATRNTSGQGRRGRNPLNNPREGATTIKEGNKFVFKNGRWVKASTSSRSHTRTGQGSRAKPAANWRSKVGQADPEKLSKQQNKTVKNHAGNKPQPKPAATPKPSGGGSNRPATTSKPSPQGSSSTSKTSSSRNVGPVANGNEYARNKDPKKYNPLMQKTFDYQKGDAPDQRAKRAAESKKYNTPDEKSKYVAPNGKPYAGPGYAGKQPASPAKPPSPNEPKRKKPSETLAEAIRRRRTNR